MQNDHNRQLHDVIRRPPTKLTPERWQELVGKLDATTLPKSFVGVLGCWLGGTPEDLPDAIKKDAISGADFWSYVNPLTRVAVVAGTVLKLVQGGYSQTIKQMYPEGPPVKGALYALKNVDPPLYVEVMQEGTAHRNNLKQQIAHKVSKEQKSLFQKPFEGIGDMVPGWVWFAVVAAVGYGLYRRAKG